jgi:hypothetical protein
MQNNNTIKYVILQFAVVNENLMLKENRIYFSGEHNFLYNIYRYTFN